MRASSMVLSVMISGALALGLAPTAFAHGDDAEQGEQDAHTPSHMLDHMQDMHRGHDHGHDFEAMEHMSPEDRDRMMSLMVDLGLVLPPMDSGRGRVLFLEKGCVACHAVNGVGGDVGPTLDAADMPEPMNAFEFAARMWRGAAAMTAMQEAQFGEVVALDGQELADIIAFAHDEAEQSKLTAEQIPKRYRDALAP